MSRTKTLAVLGGILLIVIIVAFNGRSLFGFGEGSDRDNWPTEFQSNGERLYFTGQSASGAQITASGGGMHMQMHNDSCVACHGVDRQGTRLMPKFWKVAPPLTAAALFKDRDDGASDGASDDDHDDGHGDHAGYDDATLRRAITLGIDPAGEPLDEAMPRWTISAQDMADLIAFLKTR